MILLGTTVLVLIIACANVANLTLTRLVQREREMAIRAALGAQRSSLRRQLLAENIVLSVFGGLLGMGLAVACLNLLVAYTSRFTPELVRSASTDGFWHLRWQFHSVPRCCLPGRHG